MYGETSPPQLLRCIYVTLSRTTVAADRPSGIRSATASDCATGSPNMSRKMDWVRVSSWARAARRLARSASALSRISAIRRCSGRGGSGTRQLRASLDVEIRACCAVCCSSCELSTWMRVDRSHETGTGIDVDCFGRIARHMNTRRTRLAVAVWHQQHLADDVPTVRADTSTSPRCR